MRSEDCVVLWAVEIGTDDQIGPPSVWREQLLKNKQNTRPDTNFHQIHQVQKRSQLTTANALNNVFTHFVIKIMPQNNKKIRKAIVVLLLYNKKYALTIHILDSIVAPKFTSLKIILSALYLKETSFNWRIGGDNGSVSGNFRVTSTSFSTGFNSGLKNSC